MAQKSSANDSNVVLMSKSSESSSDEASTIFVEFEGKMAVRTSGEFFYRQGNNGSTDFSF